MVVMLNLVVQNLSGTICIVYRLIPKNLQKEYGIAAKPVHERAKGTYAHKIKLQDKEDHVLNYSLAVVWRGLNLMCRRDAVREADGVAMMSFGNLIWYTFLATNTQNKTILAHRLIASISGWLP